MPIQSRGLLLALLPLLVLAGCENKGDPGDETPIGPTGYHDTDDDGISDSDEGRWEAGGSIDTDDDGIPDYLDPDSDGDGIDDVYETGDMDVTTAPTDADDDTIPDFRDNDSDGNGIDDGVEGSGDIDGDTIPDSADPDNDGDLIDDVTELQGQEIPPDSDMDGIADYNDLDSDGDNIADRHERDTDTDGDLIPDYLDLDTDGDGISDIEEAGDTDITTPPADTDGDYTHDFRDVDSDADGLPDKWENENGLNPYNPDTDLDGTTDLIEVGAETDPLDAGDNPKTRGNFVFIMYYNDPTDSTGEVRDPDPTSDHLVFSTELQMADVFFTLDSSGSMSGEISNLATSLRTTVVPGVLAEIPNVWFGAGRFEDCDSCSNNMSVVQAMTDDMPSVESALSMMTDTCGGEEPYTQNLYALATGDLTPFMSWGGLNPSSWSCPSATDFGWPCFRHGSIPIIVQFGDEDFDEATDRCSPGYTHDQAITALNGIVAKYIGVNSGSTTYGSHADMVLIANGTGSVDTSGSPLVFDVPTDGTGLGDQVVEAIEILANQVPIEVTTQLVDDPYDLVNTVDEFIDYIEPSVVGGYSDPADPTIVCASGLGVADLFDPYDGRPDSFPSILPGTIVCFDIFVKQNWTVPSDPNIPQTFLCDINVIGDGITILDTRKVYFLVPPDIDDVIPG